MVLYKKTVCANDYDLVIGKGIMGFTRVSLAENGLQRMERQEE